MAKFMILFKYYYKGRLIVMLKCFYAPSGGTLEDDILEEMGKTGTLEDDLLEEMDKMGSLEDDILSAMGK
jgi:hypothetical protein